MSSSVEKKKIPKSTRKTSPSPKKKIKSVRKKSSSVEKKKRPKSTSPKKKIKPEKLWITLTCANMGGEGGYS